MTTMYFNELVSFNTIVEEANTFAFQVNTIDGKFHHSSAIPADGKNAAIAALLEWTENRGAPWVMWEHSSNRQSGWLRVIPYEQIVKIDLIANVIGGRSTDRKLPSTD